VRSHRKCEKPNQWTGTSLTRRRGACLEGIKLGERGVGWVVELAGDNVTEGGGSGEKERYRVGADDEGGWSDRGCGSHKGDGGGHEERVVRVRMGRRVRHAAGCARRGPSGMRTQEGGRIRCAREQRVEDASAIHGGVCGGEWQNPLRLRVQTVEIACAWLSTRGWRGHDCACGLHY
jgi:hypothetical protein